MKAVNSRYDEVVQLYEKRKSYFLKTISRYSERPVQRVEPSIKTDFAPVQTVENTQVNTGLNGHYLSFLLCFSYVRTNLHNMRQ